MAMQVMAMQAMQAMQASRVKLPPSSRAHGPGEQSTSFNVGIQWSVVPLTTVLFLACQWNT
jgi:hypothetical protein